MSDPFGYKAQFGFYTDTETGLQLLTFRYYDPSSGRFLTRDPTSYLGGVNLYNYVANNPINFIDPLGLDKLPLPKHPSGLPPGWKPDPTHKNPNGERWGSLTATNSFADNGLVSRREGSTSAFYSFDSEGNVAERSDAGGIFLVDDFFSAHGSALSGTLSDPFGYKAQSGYYTDNETGTDTHDIVIYEPVS